MISSRIKQIGLSIIELMVAILIGLIILVGVVQVVISSKTSFLGQEEMSFIQENARYALEVVGRDIQNAGYWGCAGGGAKVAMVASVEDDAEDFLGPTMPLVGVMGYDGGTDTELKNEPDSYNDQVLRTTKDKEGKEIRPDSVLLRSFDNNPIAVASHVTGTLTLNGNHSFKGSDFVGIVAEDCERVGIFRAAPDTEESAVINYKEGEQGNILGVIKPTAEASVVCHKNNCSAQIPGQLYTNAAVVMPFQSRAYFVGESTVANMPSLKRAVLTSSGSTVVEEIALGIENMQILYGFQTGGDTTFKAADTLAVADWAKVTAVQVSMVFRSQSPMLPAVQSQELLDHKYEDRFARQLITSTFRIRNRI